jgi:UDP-N-acetylglucosamine--N-acetylmuramyl-(pentapeptide) pyrophosphoryl-undecaprenol N-acetylglucosamine transferase
MAEAAGIPFCAIPSGKLRRYFSWQNFTDPFRILMGAGYALGHLRDFQPHVIVSAGSFVSVPVAAVAKLLRVPHVCLQMDALPGLANRLMVPFTTAMAYYFPTSEAAFQKVPRREHVGPVVRSAIIQSKAERANARFGLDPQRPLLLVTGGGQGSAGLNQAVTSVLPLLLERFQVVHLTGKGGEAAPPQAGYQALEFVHEGMGDLLARSQLVVTRAGLGILGELAALGRDVVLVPLPNSHQEQNARAIVEQNAATLLPQAEFQGNGSAWWRAFLETYTPHDTGQRLLSFWPPQGTEAFVTLIRDVAKTH